MLTPEEQLNGLLEVRDLLLLENTEQAHRRLLELIRETPSESRYYAPMVGTANWLQPLQQVPTAMRQLAQFLLRDQHGSAPGKEVATKGN